MFEINADDMNLTDLRFCFVCGHIVSDKNVNKCEKCGSHYIFKI
jgi:rRNA maturation endonuclease Nob1